MAHRSKPMEGFQRIIHFKKLQSNSWPVVFRSSKPWFTCLTSTSNLLMLQVLEIDRLNRVVSIQLIQRERQICRSCTNRFNIITSGVPNCSSGNPTYGKLGRSHRGKCSEIPHCVSSRDYWETWITVIYKAIIPRTDAEAARWSLKHKDGVFRRNRQ